MTFAQKVTLNGKRSNKFYKSRYSIDVDLINLKPVKTIVLTYNVMVREGTQKTVCNDKQEG